MATSKHPGDDAPPTKRSKTDGNDGHDGEEPHANIRLAWGHYRNFIDGDAADEERECTSGGNEDDDEGSPDHQSDGGEADVGGGDIDELLELIEIISSGNDEAVSPLTTELSSKQDDSGCKSTKRSTYGYVQEDAVKAHEVGSAVTYPPQ